jgi:hypothetical protein
MRVLYTTTEIVFAELDDDHRLDSIPMSEIDCLHSIFGSQPPAGIDGSEQTNTRITPIIQIRTIAGGRKDGQTYCLQPLTDGQRDMILKDLTVLIDAAKRWASFTRNLEYCQTRTRQMYKSTPFQCCATTLIVAVIPQPSLCRNGAILAFNATARP